MSETRKLFESFKKNLNEEDEIKPDFDKYVNRLIELLNLSEETLKYLKNGKLEITISDGFSTFYSNISQAKDDTSLNSYVFITALNWGKSVASDVKFCFTNEMLVRDLVNNTDETLINALNGTIEKWSGYAYPDGPFEDMTEINLDQFLKYINGISKREIAKTKAIETRKTNSINLENYLLNNLPFNLNNTILKIIKQFMRDYKISKEEIVEILSRLNYKITSRKIRDLLYFIYYEKYKVPDEVIDKIIELFNNSKDEYSGFWLASMYRYYKEHNEIYSWFEDDFESYGEIDQNRILAYDKLCELIPNLPSIDDIVDYYKGGNNKDE